MNLKLFPLIAFIICQAYPISGQQQGANPGFVPGGWMGPMYAAAADAWREYFSRVQQATNQIYQQWANISGNPLSNGFGGLGAFYGIPQQTGSQQTRPPQNRPVLQGIFSPGSPQSGLQLSELLPAGGRTEPATKQEDEAMELQPPRVAETQKVPAAPRPQAAPLPAPPTQQPRVPQASQPAPQVQVVPAPPVIQQAPQVQQVAPAIQQVPPKVQQAVPIQPQQVAAAATAPLQGLGQAGSPVGVFGAGAPLGWMG